MKHKELNWQEGMLFWAHEVKRNTGQNDAGSQNRTVRYRVRFLSALYIATLAVLFGRLVYLQVFEGERQLLLADSNHIELVREEAQRGVILDRYEQLLVKNVIAGNSSSEEKMIREYPLGKAISPVVGYLSEVRQDEVGCRAGYCYEQGMMVGRAGAERVFEQELRGRDGGRVVEMDAMGVEVRSTGENLPESGQNVILSLDARLQEIAYRNMAERAGAVVALDMQGKVLAMVSSPSYDPNWFGKESSASLLENALADNERQYFLNRALGGSYAPGSVFKPVVAYAGLVSGVISEDYLIEDTGEIKIDDYRFGTWYFDQYGRKEGQLNVVRALARSNDIFFYKLGEMLGVERVVEWAKKFGLGQPTGIELSGEVVGYMPTPLLKERRVGEKWFLGNTYHLSIGQGDLTATPLQIARMGVALITGRLCDVSILRDKTSRCSDIGLPSGAKAIVKEGMKEVCQQGGTAFPFFDFSPSVLCKTGTAQHAGQKTESDKPHAWIMVAYPADSPEVMLVIFLDSAGEGSAEAGPVAKKILEEWKNTR